MKKGLKKFAASHYLLYCVVAVVAFSAVFYQLFMQGKTFIWEPDSASQHFVSFVYLGKYLREIVRNLFSGHFVIPQYNFSMGFGEDILTTLHYYVIGDPLNLISAVVPSRYAPYAYSFLIVLRYFLAGFAFTALAKYKKIPAYASVSGAMIYIFTLYSLYMTVRHPSFLNPFIYFPLIILGVEMIFDKKRPYLFILSICVSAMSSFYFFFAISIFTVLYIFVRLFFQYKEQFIKNFFISLGQFGGSYILGVLMASLVFLPVVLSFLTSSRGSVEYGLTNFFDPVYYERFIAGFVSCVYIRPGVYMGFTALALVGVLLLFLTFGKNQSAEDKKRNAFLKIAFIILTVMMMFPVFDKIINGFSYVTNRWTFVYGFLCAFIFANSLKNISVIKSGVLCMGILLFDYYIAEHANFDRTMTIQFWVYSVFVLLLFAYSIVKKATEGNCMRLDVFFRTATVVISVIAVFGNAYYIYLPNERSFTNSLMHIGEAIDFSYANSFKVMQKYQNTDTAVERYQEMFGDMSNTNSSLLNDTYSTHEYYSMANARVNELHKDIGLVYQNFSIFSTPNRDPFIDAAESVKYIISVRADDTFYGVNTEPLETFKTDINFAEKNIYECESYVPFGFTYDKAVSADDYGKLSSTEKRAMLVNAVVLNDNDELVNAQAAELGAGDILPEFTVTSDGRAEIYDNKIVVKEDGAIITLRADNVPDGQLYCVFDNIRFEDIAATSSWLLLEGNGRQAKFNITTPYNDYYSGITDYVANFGYCSSGSTEITIGLRLGEYTFDSLHLAVQSLDNYDEKVSALSEDTLQNLEIGTDKITGDIALDEDKFLFISVPYSEYWTAEVDGEEAEIFRANTAFMALKLDAGEHTVELKYNNKSIGKSAFVSLLGVAAFAGLVVVLEKKKKNK